MPPDARIVMGWETPDGQHSSDDVATVLEHVYQRGQLTDEFVCGLVGGRLPQPEAPATHTFARRAAGRELQQELVAGWDRLPLVEC